jgi:hypothetical protein
MSRSFFLLLGMAVGAFAVAMKPNVLVILATDLGEWRNFANDEPERIQEMLGLMDQLVSEGRSTPGAKRSNDVPATWRRHMPTPQRP